MTEGLRLVAAFPCYDPPRMSVHEFVTAAAIRATREAVWDVLADTPRYVEWNPEIVGMAGHMALGERLSASVKVGSGAVRRVTLRVSICEPPVRMEWIGSLPLGLFTGRRELTITGRDGFVEFRMVVRMSGPLAGAMMKAVGDRQAEIDAFSHALKARVEQMSSAAQAKA